MAWPTTAWVGWEGGDMLRESAAVACCHSLLWCVAWSSVSDQGRELLLDTVPLFDLQAVDTLVLLMAGSTLAAVMQRLRENGKPDTTPVGTHMPVFL